MSSIPTMEMSTRWPHPGRGGSREQRAGRVDVALAPPAGGQVQDRVGTGDRLADAGAGEQVPGRQIRAAAPAERSDVVPGHPQAGDGGDAERAGARLNLMEGQTQ